MGRTYDEWIKLQDQDVVAKTRAGDEGNKVLLNQINCWWCGIDISITTYKKGWNIS